MLTSLSPSSTLTTASVLVTALVPVVGFGCLNSTHSMPLCIHKTITVLGVGWNLLHMRFKLPLPEDLEFKWAVSPATSPAAVPMVFFILQTFRVLGRTIFRLEQTRVCVLYAGQGLLPPPLNILPQTPWCQYIPCAVSSNSPFPLIRKAKKLDVLAHKFYSFMAPEPPTVRYLYSECQSFIDLGRRLYPLARPGCDQDSSDWGLPCNMTANKYLNISRILLESSGRIHCIMQTFLDSKYISLNLSHIQDLRFDGGMFGIQANEALGKDRITKSCDPVGDYSS